MPAFKLLQHAIGSRPMQIQFFFSPAIQRGDHERLIQDREADVSNETNVQDPTDRVPVVRPPNGYPSEFAAAGLPHTLPLSMRMLA